MPVETNHFQFDNVSDGGEIDSQRRGVHTAEFEEHAKRLSPTASYISPAANSGTHFIYPSSSKNHSSHHEHGPSSGSHYHPPRSISPVHSPDQAYTKLPTIPTHYHHSHRHGSRSQSPNRSYSPANHHYNSRPTTESLAHGQPTPINQNTTPSMRNVGTRGFSYPYDRSSSRASNHRPGTNNRPLSRLGTADSNWEQEV